ncbi:MAG: hypothetical protein IKJ36_06605 [Clostridia bacterium]|nr:hypothetical protein [Clostridia bacterium]
MEENKRRGVALIDVLLFVFIFIEIVLSVLGEDFVDPANAIHLLLGFVCIAILAFISLVTRNTIEKRKIQLVLMLVVQICIIMISSTIVKCFCHEVYPDGYVKDVWHYLSQGRSFLPITAYLIALMFIYNRKLKPVIESEVMSTSKMIKIFFINVVLGIVVGFSRTLFSALTGIH